MITIPSEETKQWQQSNASDVLGNISVTKNITFDKKGYLRLSYASRPPISQTFDANFDEPAVILRSQDHGYFVQTHDQPWKLDADRILGIRPTEETTVGNPSGDIQSDATFIGGLLLVTSSTGADFYSPTPNTWTNTNISLASTAQGQHPVEGFPSLASIAVANVNTVLLYATPITATPTLSVTLTILADFYITGLAYFNQNLYISTMNRFGGKALLYVWNGYGTAAQSAYEVDSNMIYDVVNFQDSIVIFTGKGQILRFNGSGFTVLDNLPIYYTRRAMSDDVNHNMFHNCLKAFGSILYINVSSYSNDLKLTNQPDGIWCYDADLGYAYHRYSLSNALVNIETVATASVNTTTDVITVVTAPITGTEVLYSANGTAITGLVDGAKYFVIYVTGTTIKLATTLTLAQAGTAIDLTGTGNDAQTFVFFPKTDFGQYLLGRTAAICPIERVIEDPQFGTDLIWGGDVAGRTKLSTGFLGTVSTVIENRGYFITPKIFSAGLKDTYNLISLKFSPFVSELDKIIIKYRVTDDKRNEIDTTPGRWAATWTSSTTFTTTEPEFANAVVGDEVEFLSGGGSGILAHITVISLNAGTYTITIDETYSDYTAGDLATVVFRNWIKWQTIAYGDDNATQGFLSTQLGVVGKFIQFKVELRGVQIEIEGLDIDNVYHLPSKK